MGGKGARTRRGEHFWTGQTSCRVPDASRENREDFRIAPLRRKLLARRPPLSEGRSAMNSLARSQNCARVVIATVLFAAFSWTLLVSVSPQLHACIHSDANRSDHVCAITLIASGSYEHGAQPPVISPPQFDVSFAATAELTSTWVSPLFLNAHIFAHAPPALV